VVAVSFFCKMVEDFRLSHALSACRGFGRHSLVDTSDETLLKSY
jgi:hypothetical protein